MSMLVFSLMLACALAADPTLIIADSIADLLAIKQVIGQASLAADLLSPQQPEAELGSALPSLLDSATSLNDSTEAIATLATESRVVASVAESALVEATKPVLEATAADVMADVAESTLIEAAEAVLGADVPTLVAAEPRVVSDVAESASVAAIKPVAGVDIRAVGKEKYIRESNNLATYDPTLASRAVDFAGAAYCCAGLGRGCEKWTCPSCARHPGVNVTVIANPNTNANGFVAYESPKNTIVISFCGTDPLSITNWLEDLNFGGVSYPNCTGCVVHRGFYDTYNSVKQQVHAAVQWYLRDHPTAPLLITGHSLGGALAVHAALDMYVSFGLKATTYTFGQPRVGNAALAQFLGTLGVYFRVTHFMDPVPQLPPQSFNFRHTPVEVYYDELEFGYRVCDSTGEDPRCSNQWLLDLVVTDHLNYVHFDFVSNYLICKL